MTRYPTVPTRLGLLGCGTVGAAVVRAASSPPLSTWLEVDAVAVRDPVAPRACDTAALRFTTDPLAVAGGGVDVVVEVMGGIDPARPAIVAALQRGVPVVTANKALLGEYGPELRRLAAEHATPLRFEAAVAASIPVVATIVDHLATDRIRRLRGVLNGTSTFVLCRMTEGRDYADAVALAQQLGYAEADPSRDVDGTDAADKLALLAQLAWGDDLVTSAVPRWGIDQLSSGELATARRRSRVWRLVATAGRDGCATVEPRDLTADDPLARVVDADCGVQIDADRAGTLTLVGPGAGGDATAAAVLADVHAVSAAARTALAS